MDKQAFTKYCADQLNAVFIAAKKGKTDDKLKHRSEGLLLAGELLGVITKSEASELIEQEHIAVFGETSAQRAERKNSLQAIKNKSPDAYFDIPAIERRK
jgi:hypothetical protein